MWPLLQPIFDLQAFADLSNGHLLRLFFRTLWMSLVSASIAVGIGLPLAMLATRTCVAGGLLIALMTPLPLLLPPLLIAQAWNGLTGFDGQWASIITLGFCFAPLPALLVARALSNQHASAHESALLLGGRRQALREMLRLSWPAAAMGGALVFLFASTDFAVPDYFASIGEPFKVYPAHVFNQWRYNDYWAGAKAASPLVLLDAVVLFVALSIRDRWAVPVQGQGRKPARLHLGNWQWLATMTTWGTLVLLLILPLGRIIFETGLAGSEAAGTWGSRSIESLQGALQRGREDIGRSLSFASQAALIVMLVAPFLAHWLIRHRGLTARIGTVALALPLLVPAVGYGLGAIVAANRPQFGDFYHGTTLVALVMAGRFLPIAVFLLAERFQRIPANQLQAAQLAGIAYPLRLYRLLLLPNRSAWLLTFGLVMVFAVRELDLAILLPGSNNSAAVRYFNALHFARDGFVAAFGLLIAGILFLPATLFAAWTAWRSDD